MDDMKYYKRIVGGQTTQLWCCFDEISDQASLITACCEIIMLVVVNQEDPSEDLIGVPIEEIKAINQDEFRELAKGSNLLTTHTAAWEERRAASDEREA